MCKFRGTYFRGLHTLKNFFIRELRERKSEHFLFKLKVRHILERSLSTT